MPQVDLEALVSACAGASSANERKIACEETFVEGDRTKGRDYRFKESDQVEVNPDFPPESFCLSKDAELDWFDRNAFFERKESTKGSSNLMYLNSNGNPASSSNSQRFSSSFKSKASIIGLPKLHKTFFADAKNRRTCKPGNARWFPKRSGSVPKLDSSLVEPSSPKVSCMGRVKSKRDRKRRSKNRDQSSGTTESKEKTSMKKTKRGFFKNFFAVLQFSCKRHPAVEHSASFAVSPPRKSAAARDVPSIGATKAPTLASLPRKSTESEPPGLGSMNRFSSGRRSAEFGVCAAE